VRLLLDTHVLLWWVTDNPALSADARRAVADSSNSVHISVGSLWEIAIKVGKKKLTLFDGFDEVLDREPFIQLAISASHVRAVATLPPIHGDPFDRLFVAQAQAERLTLVTHDPLLARYGVPTLTA
jgi:PIN domain nuclease of toxin-antitoxin system